MAKMARILPGSLCGSVEAVPSKSDAHRALIAAALAGGESRLSSWGTSDDVLCTARCLEGMGLARIDGQRYAVRGLGPVRGWPRVHCGQSGSTLRFLIPLALALGEGAEFTGEGRLMQRPLSVYEQLFTAQGIGWSLEGDSLRLRGHLSAGTFSLPGNISSQFITGLCFALPLLPGDSRLQFTTPLESEGYVGMTLDTLRRFGIVIEREDSGLFIPGGQRYTPCDYAIEGDWSYGAFWLCAGAVSGRITVGWLHRPTLQGDSAVYDILGRMGADLQTEGDRVIVQAGPLHGTQVDLAPIPDLAPVLAVAACAARGETRFIHAQRLRMKESDRLTAILDMVAALGGCARVEGDGYVITGTGGLRGGTVDVRADHRMAMAAAVASVAAQQPITVNDKDCVAKSAPDFWRHFAALGGKYYE